MTVGALGAVAVGIPSDVIANPWFTRMTPVQWWSYLILLGTAVLSAVWAALPSKGPSKGCRISGASLLCALSVGCPICNKVAVATLGVSGAFALWAPVQPVLGAGSVALVGVAALARWRSGARVCALAVGQSTVTTESVRRPRRDHPATAWSDHDTVDTILTGPRITASHPCCRRDILEDLGIGSADQHALSDAETRTTLPDESRHANDADPAVRSAGVPAT